MIPTPGHPSGCFEKRLVFKQGGYVTLGYDFGLVPRDRAQMVIVLSLEQYHAIQRAIRGSDDSGRELLEQLAQERKEFCQQDSAAIVQVMVRDCSRARSVRWLTWLQLHEPARSTDFQREYLGLPWTEEEDRHYKARKAARAYHAATEAFDRETAVPAGHSAWSWSNDNARRERDRIYDAKVRHLGFTSQEWQSIIVAVGRELR